MRDMLSVRDAPGKLRMWENLVVEPTTSSKNLTCVKTARLWKGWRCASDGHIPWARHGCHGCWRAFRPHSPLVRRANCLERRPQYFNCGGKGFWRNCNHNWIKRTHRREGHSDYKEHGKVVRDPAPLRRQVETPRLERSPFQSGGKAFRTSPHVTVHEEIQTEPFCPRFGPEFPPPQTIGASKVWLPILGDSEG